MICGNNTATRIWKPVAIFALFMTTVVFAPSHAIADMNTVEMNDILDEAGHLFDQANELVSKDSDGANELYRKAIVRYERIVREGNTENGKLYYNIGNAYFRTKDIGRAILNYRRSEKYIPNDPNVQQNLQFARSRRVDKVEETQQKKVLNTIFFWHYDLSTRTRSILFGIGFVGIWVFAALRLFMRRGVLTWFIALNVCLAVLFLGSVSIEALRTQSVHSGVVLAEEVMARKGDSVSYAQSFKDSLHAGTEFALLEDRGDWYEIELADTRRCWIPAKDVGLIVPKNNKWR